MARQQDVDELFDIKNSYYIGNYQQCINEAQKIKLTNPDLIVEKDVYVYRSFIAQQKFRVVLDEITPSSPKKLTYVRILAEYLAYPDKRQGILSSLDKEKVSSTDVSETDLYRLICATIMNDAGNYEKALEHCFYAESLECKALSVQIHIKLNRVDLAKIELKKMLEKDEDSTLTQIVQAWIYIYMSGEKIRDAFYIFQEIMDKYGSTNMLLNGQAVTQICQAKFDEAESTLQEALSKDPNNPDTLQNMIVVSYHLAKPEVALRFLSQLKESYSNIEFLKNYQVKNNEFKNLCEMYKPSVTV